MAYAHCYSSSLPKELLHPPTRSTVHRCRAVVSWSRVDRVWALVVGHLVDDVPHWPLPRRWWRCRAVQPRRASRCRDGSRVSECIQLLTSLSHIQSPLEACHSTASPSVAGTNGARARAVGALGERSILCRCKFSAVSLSFSARSSFAS